MRRGHRTALATPANTLNATVGSLSFYLLRPTNVWGMLAITAFISIVYAPTIPLTWAIFADVADFSEWKTGRRFTGMVFATIGFALKSGLALGSASFLWIMGGFFHYDTKLPSAPDAVAGYRFASGIAVCAYAQTEPVPLWAGQIGASYVANSGNTNNSTVGASGELEWRPGRFRTVANSEFIRTTNDRVLGSKRIAASLRTEHTIPLRLSVYGKTAYFEDVPAGIRHQFSVTAGGLAHVLRGERRSLALMFALTKTSEQRVVAPDREVSACGQALTLGHPVEARELAPRVYAANGTPADCVALAVQRLMGGRPSLVVSGINLGGNIGTAFSQVVGDLRPEGNKL